MCRNCFPRAFHWTRRLVVFEHRAGAYHRVKSFPAPRGDPVPPKHKSLRGFGYIGSDYSHIPMAASDAAFALRSGDGRAVRDDSFSAHYLSAAIKSPRRSASAPRQWRWKATILVRGGAIFLSAAKARSPPTPALAGVGVQSFGGGGNSSR